MYMKRLLDFFCEEDRLRPCVIPLCSMCIFGGLVMGGRVRWHEARWIAMDIFL
jgi:hypothetical protein